MSKEAERRRQEEAELAEQPICQGHPECPRTAFYFRLVATATGDVAKIWICDRHQLQFERISKEEDGRRAAAQRLEAINYRYNPSLRRWEKPSQAEALR